MNYTTNLLKILFLIKKPFSKCQRAGNVQAPLTFASWNQIVQDMRNIYKLKELIKLPASAISSI